MDGLIIGLLLPFAGTTLGAACVFLMKKQMPDLVQKTLLENNDNINKKEEYEVCNCGRSGWWCDCGSPDS